MLMCLWIYFLSISKGIDFHGEVVNMVVWKTVPIFTASGMRKLFFLSCAAVKKIGNYLPIFL